MRPTRRHFLYSALAGTVGAQTPLVGTARAAETVALQGKIHSAAGEGVRSSKIQILGGGEFYTASSDSSGAFSVDVPVDTTYKVGFYKFTGDTSQDDIDPSQNGVPHVYGLGEFAVGDEPKDIGTVTLPEAHVVEVRATDEDGDPVEYARPNVNHDGWGFGSKVFTTDEDGYLVIEGASETGVELAGEVRLSMKPPRNSEQFTQSTFRRQVTVDGDTSVTFELNGDIKGSETTTTTTDTTTTATTETTTTAATATTATTADTTAETTRTDTTTASANETTRQAASRGFFTNSGDGPEFLQNVMNLTVLGFLLSAAGIVHQMIKGR